MKIKKSVMSQNQAWWRSSTYHDSQLRCMGC